MYHGCDKRNRNGINKFIDYERGEICLIPTSKQCWKPIRKKSETKMEISETKMVISNKISGQKTGQRRIEREG